MAHALKDMQKRYPLLALPSHGLYAIVQDFLFHRRCLPGLKLWVQECETAVCEGDEEKAKDILERLEHEVDLEAAVCEFQMLLRPFENSRLRPRR